MFTETKELTLSSNGRLALWLVVTIPIVAAVWGILDALFITPAGRGWEILQFWPHWLLATTAFGCGTAITVLLHRGIRSGRLFPIRLVVLALIPWIFGLVLGPIAGALQRSQWDQFPGDIHVLMGMRMDVEYFRLAGLLMSWPLIAAVTLSLAGAAILWRPPGPRLRGVVIALIAAVPLFAYLVYLFTSVAGEQPFAFSILVTLVMLILAIEMAGATLGSSPNAHPKPSWIMAVPACALMTVLAATTVIVVFAMAKGMTAVIVAPAPGLTDVASETPSQMAIGEALRSMLSPYPAASVAIKSRWVLFFAEGTRLVGVALAVIPLVVFGVRLRGLRIFSGKGLHPAVSVLLLGIAVVVSDDLSGRSGIRSVEEMSRSSVRSSPASETQPAEEQQIQPARPPPPPPPKPQNQGQSTFSPSDVVSLRHAGQAQPRVSRYDVALHGEDIILVSGTRRVSRNGELWPVSDRLDRVLE